MQDAIMKGNGNSRYLKTVGEALSLYPTYEDFLQAMIAGTFPVDFNGINKDGWTQLGTPLNKANLLSDTVISTLGLSTGANSTPNDAFNVLANVGNVHVWRKTVTTDEGIPEVPEVPPSYELGEAQTQYFIRDKDRGKAITMLYSNSVSVSYDGRVSLVSPSSVVITTTNTTYPFTYVSGKFIQAQGGGTGVEPETTSIFYMKPSGVLQNSGESSSWDVYGTECQMVNGIAAVPGTPAVPPGTHVTYLTSVNRNAYQEGDDAKEAGYVLGEVVTGKTAISMTYNRCSITYCSAIEVNNNGTISPAPNSGGMNIPTNNMDSDDLSALKGKFFHTEGSENDSDQIGFFSDPNYWAYIPEDAVITMETHPVGSPAIYITKYQPVTGYPAIPAGTTIEYLGVLGEKSKIQVLSYVGTGTSGEANPCSVTASFPIKALFFLGYIGEFGMDPSYLGVGNGYWGDGDVGIMFSKCLTTAFTNHIGFDANGKTSFGKKSADGKTFYWYNKTSAVTNDSGSLYYFLALG